MKKNLLAELNHFVQRVMDADRMHYLDSDIIRRGLQLLMASAKEIAVLRSSHTKLHGRALLAEGALPEWKEICRATAGQATGRFFPALLRLALVKAEEAHAALTVKVERQAAEMKHLNDLYFKSFELAGGKPDDNPDDLPRLIEILRRREATLDEALELGREICSPIGTIPGTANLGPGLTSTAGPVDYGPVVLPLQYELAIDNGKVFIRDATLRLIFTIGMNAMRGRSLEKDLRDQAILQIKKITRSIEERNS